jgi:hypothetical protein
MAPSQSPRRRTRPGPSYHHDMIGVMLEVDDPRRVQPTELEDLVVAKWRIRRSGGGGRMERARMKGGSLGRVQARVQFEVRVRIGVR